MLVVVSDLHMTDRATGASVTDKELIQLTEDLCVLTPRDAPLTLLLLGDIVDLLRSETWDSLWEKDGAAPWTGLGPRFSNFEDNYQEQALLDIIAGIEKKYGGFFKALAKLKASRDTRILYVIGNHDFMLQLSPKAREHIVRLFLLDQQPEQEFPEEFFDKALDVYADHGHRQDDLNYHQRHAGRWAMGDAIVLRIVNEFARRARKDLRVKSATALGKAVDEIDNVEPHHNIPVYVEWLARTQLVSKTDQNKLRVAWREAVMAFLDLPEFREKRYGKLSTTIKWTRELYGLFDLASMLRHLDSIPVAFTRNGHVQHGYAVKTKAAVRVFGHTHAPGLIPLPNVGGKRAFYVNTGAWRANMARIGLEGSSLDFAAHRVSTMLIVRAPGEFELVRRARCP